jgi:hypothetical protein
MVTLTAGSAVRAEQELLFESRLRLVVNTANFRKATKTFKSSVNDMLWE